MVLYRLIGCCWATWSDIIQMSFISHDIFLVLSLDVSTWVLLLIFRIYIDTIRTLLKKKNPIIDRADERARHRGITTAHVLYH